MTAATLIIPLAFILLATLLCWHAITAKGRWGVKLAFILIVPSFGIAVWYAMASYQGWPTSEGPPDKALLLWAEVREPDPSQGEEGSIYVWLVPLEESAGSGPSLRYAHPRGEPRAHKLPYSRRAHERLARAMDMVREGRPVVMESRDAPASDEGVPGDPGTLGEPGMDGGSPHRESLRPGGGAGGHDQEFMFYELPEPLPPPKDR